MWSRSVVCRSATLAFYIKHRGRTTYNRRRWPRGESPCRHIHTYIRGEPMSGRISVFLLTKVSQFRAPQRPQAILGPTTTLRYLQLMYARLSIHRECMLLQDGRWWHVRLHITAARCCCWSVQDQYCFQAIMPEPIENKPCYFKQIKTDRIFITS